MQKVGILGAEVSERVLWAEVIRIGFVKGQRPRAGVGCKAVEMVGQGSSVENKQGVFCAREPMRCVRGGVVQKKVWNLGCGQFEMASMD